MDNIKQEIKSTTESVAKRKSIESMDPILYTKQYCIVRSKSFSRVDSAVKALEEINAMVKRKSNMGSKNIY
jgi:hypothetical protein